MPSVTRKVCGTCDTEKSLDDFHKASGKKDGRQPVCKACKSEHAKNRYAAKPEQFAKTKRRWVVENKAHKSAYDRRWRQANPDKIAAKAKRRRDRVAALPGGRFDGRRKDYQEKIAAQGGRCALCGLEATLTADHLVPASREGSSNAVENIVGSCMDCQTSRGSRLLDEWRQFLEVVRPDHPFVRRSA